MSDALCWCPRLFRSGVLDRLKNAYFGWYTVLAGSIIACWGYGCWYYGMSALFLPLITEYGWTRAQLSAAFSMRSIEGGLEGPFGGMLIDRYGPRVITVISTIISSAGLILTLFVRDIWQFVIVWGFVVSLGYNLGLYDTVNAAVAKWFVRRRSFALSMVTVGGGLGGPVIVPVMTWIITEYGWRSALLFVAASTMLICLPLAWFLIRTHPPEHYGLRPDGDGVRVADAVVGTQDLKADEYDFTTTQALKTTSFWTLLIASTLDAGTLAKVTMHQMPFLQGIGVDELAAAGILGMLATMSLPSRPVFAWLADRWSERNTLILSFVLKALGLLIFMNARTLVDVTLFVLVYGLGYGGAMPVKHSIRASYFGRRAFATITGYTTLFGALTNIAYPVFAGWSYDVTGSYSSAFGIIAALQALAVVFMILAKKPKPPKP